MHKAPPARSQKEAATDAKYAFPYHYKSSALTKVAIPRADNSSRNVYADICYPKDSTGNPKAPRGVFVFLHGFGQLPMAYHTTIRKIADDGILVIAPRGATSLPGWFSPYETQAALREDGLLCIDYVTGDPTKVILLMKDDTNEAKPLSTYLPKRVKELVLGGHSIGAGLCFSLAVERPDTVRAIAAMAPWVNLEPQFNPVGLLANPGVDLKRLKATLLAGKCDPIATPQSIMVLHDAFNRRSKDQQATYEARWWYTHSSFEDDLRLLEAPLDEVAAAALVLVSVLNYFSIGQGALCGALLQGAEVVLQIGAGYLLLIRPIFYLRTPFHQRLIVDFVKDHTPRA